VGVRVRVGTRVKVGVLVGMAVGRPTNSFWQPVNSNKQQQITASRKVFNEACLTGMRSVMGFRQDW
jgi:hypothetical protein